MPHRPSSSPDLDKQLKEYLDNAQREREGGYTLEGLYREVADFKCVQNERNRQFDELAAEHKALRLRVDRHGRDIRDLKAHVYNRDAEEFDTGVHQVDDLKRHLAAREAELAETRKAKADEESWWKRKKVEWTAAAIGGAVALSVGGVGTVAWYLLIHATSK